MITVLITTGKQGHVDTAEVQQFSKIDDAEEFCKKASTGRCKYWTLAQIIEIGEEVALEQPD